jgi:hypothetical protein
MSALAAFLRWWRTPTTVRLAKGGLNNLPLPGTPRPPPPVPIRRTQGYQPHSDASQSPPPRGVTTATLLPWMPQTTMVIPMPAGAAMPLESHALTAITAVTLALRNAEAVMNDALALATTHDIDVSGTFFHIGATDKFCRTVTLKATHRLL